MSFEELYQNNKTIKLINEHDKLVAEVERLKQIHKIANNVLYFDDNSDYSTALWQILALCMGKKEDDDMYDVKLQYMEDEE